MGFWAWLKSLFVRSQPAIPAPVQPAPTIPEQRPILTPSPTLPHMNPNGKELGIDMYHGDDMPDFVKAKSMPAYGSNGVQRAFLKASEGVNHIDSMLRTFAKAAQAAGIKIGAYHFFHASMNGDLQAQNFLMAIKGMKLDLPCVLDWESGSADGQPVAKQREEAIKWLNAVEKATGIVPIIYGGEAFLRDLKLGLEFAKYPLWLAHYGVRESDIKIPMPWTKLYGWQFTDSGTVGGLKAGHHVDTNWFYN